MALGVGGVEGDGVVEDESDGVPLDDVVVEGDGVVEEVAVSVSVAIKFDASHTGSPPIMA